MEFTFNIYDTLIQLGSILCKHFIIYRSPLLPIPKPDVESCPLKTTLENETLSKTFIHFWVVFEYDWYCVFVFYFGKINTKWKNAKLIISDCRSVISKSHMHSHSFLQVSVPLSPAVKVGLMYKAENAKSVIHL